jgi:hypothetical protein
MIYRNLSQDDMYDLLRAYDTYIYKASEAGLFQKGWQPHDVTTFYNDEYQTVWKNKGDSENAEYDCWNYMYSIESN